MTKDEREAEENGETEEGWVKVDGTDMKIVDSMKVVQEEPDLPDHH